MVCPWLDSSLPPRCPQVVWCHWAILCHADHRVLTECGQPQKNPLKYSTMTRNWTRATGKTDSDVHSFSHWAIMTDGLESTCIKHWFRTVSQCHSVTVSQFHSVTVSQCHSVTVSQCHSVTVVSMLSKNSRSMQSTYELCKMSTNP